MAIGSWGLPELGITERLSDFFGQGRTSTGGSNLFGNQAQTTLVPSGTSGGQTQFAPSGSSGAYGIAAPGTKPVNQSAIAKTGGTGGTQGTISAPTNTDHIPTQEEIMLAQQQNNLRNEIGSGWDQYINSLNDQLGGLETQRMGQEQIAQAGYQQGLNTLGLQKNQGIGALGTEREALAQNQSKTLRDLAENQRQAFQAGNNFLGTKGASDSSAANQYSFALAKEAGRQRGDIMTNTSNQLQEINKREENLNNIYNTEVNNLEQTKNAQFGQIAQWFGDAQNKLKQAQASGQLSKSQDLASLSKDILNQAIAEMNRINTEISGRKTALENWAMTNSQNIAQLKANMQQASQFSAQLPQAQNIAGTPTVDSSGNMRTAFNYGTGLTEEERRRRALTGNIA